MAPLDRAEQPGRSAPARVALCPISEGYLHGAEGVSTATADSLQQRRERGRYVRLSGQHVNGYHLCLVNEVGRTTDERPWRVVGRYVIYDQVAQGGTARVHIARRIGPDKFSRFVVMKSLKPVFALDEELRTMLRDEAWLSARITHPNVVPVIDVESSDTEMWLALEYIHGETLTGLKRNAPGVPCPVPIAAAIFSGVLRGLHAAHELRDESGQLVNLVHRDVSPQNIIVGVDGVARVLDFGIAKALGRSQATRDGEVKGKLAYMAPEQLYGETVSRRTDIYACAVVMWETLTGQRLFLGATETETIARVAKLQVPPVSRLVAVPETIDALLLKALDRDESLRFQTALEMAEALDAAVEGATPSQVGAWVALTASEALRERQAIISRIEREAPRSEEILLKAQTHTRLVAAREEPRRRSPELFWSLGLIGLVGLAAIFGLWWHRDVAPASASSSELVAQPLVTVTSGAEPAAPAAVVVTPVAEPPLAAPEVPSKEEPPSRRPPRRAARAEKSGPCDPPYVIDAQGHKRFRRECL